MVYALSLARKAGSLRPLAQQIPPHGARHLAHRGPRAHAVAPGLQLRMGIGHGRAHAIAEDLRHVEGDVGVGVAAGQPFLVANRLLHAVIEGERGGARLDGGGIVGRGLQAHQADDRREVDLVGLVLQQAGAGARLGLGRPQRGLGLDRSRSTRRSASNRRSRRSPSISTGTWRLGLMRSTSGCLGWYSVFISKGTMMSSKASPFSWAAISALAPNMLSGPE